MHMDMHMHMHMHMCVDMYRRNTDGRRKRDGDPCNFYIYYDFDGEEVATVLSLDQYDGTEQYAWVLLESTEEAEPMEVAAAAADAAEQAHGEFEAAE